MDPPQIFVLFIVLVLVTIAFGCIFKSERSPFSFPSRMKTKNPLPDPFYGGVLNAKYQYDSPNVVNESQYYECLVKDCRGNTHNFDCLERCRLKVMTNNNPEYISPLKSANCIGKSGDDYLNCLVYQYAKYQ